MENLACHSPNVLPLDILPSFQQDPHDRQEYVDLLPRLGHPTGSISITVCEIQTSSPQQQSKASSRFRKRPLQRGRCKSQRNVEDECATIVESVPMRRTSSIHICRCDADQLRSLLTAVPADLTQIDEIHFSNIASDAPDDEVEASLLLAPARPPPMFTSTVANCVIAILERSTPKRLVLRDCNLRVSDVFRIMEMLRERHSHQLEYLDLRHNALSPHVIEYLLSIHLGDFRAMKELYLRQGIRCVVHQRVRNTMLRVLKENRHHGLENVDLFGWDRSIQHHLDLNRAGRRILQHDCVPAALWAALLERAIREETLRAETTSATARPSSLRRVSSRLANVIYFLLRNGPVLFEK